MNDVGADGGIEKRLEHVVLIRREHDGLPALPRPAQ
jgi:hypothetical protein